MKKFVSVLMLVAFMGTFLFSSATFAEVDDPSEFELMSNPSVEKFDSLWIDDYILFYTYTDAVIDFEILSGNSVNIVDFFWEHTKVIKCVEVGTSTVKVTATLGDNTISKTLDFTVGERDKQPSFTNNLPKSIKIGESFKYSMGSSNIDKTSSVDEWDASPFVVENLNYGAYFIQLKDSTNSESRYNFQNSFFSGHYDPSQYVYVSDDRSVSIGSIKREFFALEAAYKPGEFLLQPVVRNSYIEIDDSWSEKDWGTPVSFKIEEPIITDNVPANVKPGTSIDFKTELTNTALTNRKVAPYDEDYKKYVEEHGNDSGYICRAYDGKVYDEPAYRPSVEVIEGKDIVKQENQDYGNTLYTTEKLTFTGKGTVKLKIKYNQISTCYRCISQEHTYNPEKIITINVSDSVSDNSNTSSGPSTSDGNTKPQNNNKKNPATNDSSFMFGVSIVSLFAISLISKKYGANK